MTAQEMIDRLRKMKGSGDDKGAFLGMASTMVFERSRLLMSWNDF